MALCPRGSHHLLRSKFNAIQNYHAELGFAFASFMESVPCLCGVVFPIGPSCCLCVGIVTCMLFIIQDVQEGDMLCGHFGTHASGVQYHCQSCDVQYNHRDDWKITCEFVEASGMTHTAERSDVATRTQWSQHQLRNAFNGIILLILCVESLVQHLLKQCMPLGKVLLRMLQNLFCQKFQLPRRLHLTIWLVLFMNLIGKHFIRHIQDKLEQWGYKSCKYHCK